MVGTNNTICIKAASLAHNVISHPRTSFAASRPQLCSQHLLRIMLDFCSVLDNHTLCTRNNKGADAKPTAARWASARRMAQAPPTNLTRAFKAAAGNSQASQAAPGSLNV